MPDRTPVTVAGASGRMGAALRTLLHDHPTLRLGACLERSGHPWLSGGGPQGVPVTDDPAAALAVAPVVVDFTAPEASVAIARAAAARGAVHVIGTTGFDADTLAALVAAGQGAVSVRAGNMSLGVNLLVQLTRRVAAALGPEFDIEIIEAHHRAKRDAPSGTALMLGEAAAEGRGVALDTAAERARDGLCGPRADGAIGFAVVRGGDIVGEHDVVFAGPGERIVLRHMATDRTIFARGALKAADWALGRPAGDYDMLDVLGI
ncbi:4-hydroxy-tetrahydrodipicolinate reductase [Rhodobaculum claviforme]|uniref:4-hydroxy-tetrahydrodipicolinate reductase n=1 Tax=Rhodobaculum claviforme TaxID=1549854 RepID=A0A934WJ99_9RHOB|nr:4-hydroxy-tetrahydrodipicolinate reductase [Rhodobaculum claviforme]MBK5927298.1 4-hydroxy-tetrahydrodipicolinate reductase [Rhodobaculum claviforme]